MEIRYYGTYPILMFVLKLYRRARVDYATSSSLHYLGTNGSSHANIGGAQQSSTGHSAISDGYKPSFVTDEELKQLAAEAAGAFLFVVSLGTPALVVSYVTDTVKNVLGVPQVRAEIKRWGL